MFSGTNLTRSTQPKKFYFHSQFLSGLLGAGRVYYLYLSPKRGILFAWIGCLGYLCAQPNTDSQGGNWKGPTWLSGRSQMVICNLTDKCTIRSHHKWQESRRCQKRRKVGKLTYIGGSGNTSLRNDVEVETYIFVWSWLEKQEGGNNTAGRGGNVCEESGPRDRLTSAITESSS